eukprot:g5802.t1
MDCVFTPVDKSNNTGPVVGGCHDALRRLRHHWEGTAWFLKITLLGLHKLLQNEQIEVSFGARMSSGKFLSFTQSLGGANAFLSQSVANIHLHQLDLLIAKIQLECQAPELLDPTSIKGTKFDRLSSVSLGDKNFVRVRYVRHGDEILVGKCAQFVKYRVLCIGIASNRGFAERVSQRICCYLSESLDMEFEANLSHVSEEPPMFLGVRISPYIATKFARRFERELESRRRIRRRVMLRAAQREVAWNNKLRKLALSALALGIKKTRRILGPKDARQALIDKCTQLAHQFVLDPANSEACRALLRDAVTIEKTFAEELGWISLPTEIREAHKHLTAVIKKHLQSMK